MVAFRARCSFAALLLVAVAALAVSTSAGAAPPAPRKGLVQGVAEAIWQICTVCSGVDSVEEVEEEACPLPKELGDVELSDIRAVACHYMNMAAYTMWHNYSGSPEDLQAENAGLAGAIQLGLDLEYSEEDLVFTVVLWANEVNEEGAPSACAIGLEEASAERPPLTSFDKSGGICSAPAISVFGIARHYAILWSRPDVALDPKDQDLIKHRNVFRCLKDNRRPFGDEMSNDNFSYWLRHLPSVLSYNPQAIAGCLVDRKYVSFRPAAVVVLQFQTFFSFYSDGLVYVNDFGPFALEALRWYISAQDFEPLVVPDYKLIMIF